MRSKESIIGEFEYFCIRFNKYWEDPLVNTELRVNTEEAIDKLGGYFNLLHIRKKKYSTINDYTKFPEDIQFAISGIIQVVSDGRDLRHNVEYHHCKKDLVDESKEITRSYNHNVEENGYLPFENNPWVHLDLLLKDIQDFKEISESESKTGSIQKYCNGKWYYFEGYESGSYYVKFSKININKNGDYIFDGTIIELPTVNTKHNADGILFIDEHDVDFCIFPYFDNEIETNKDFIKYMDKIETFNLDELKEDLNRILNDHIDEYCLSEN